MQQENYEKLNKKLVAQIKKFSRLKEARKRVAEKSQRLEKKVMILNSKVAQYESQPRVQPQPAKYGQRNRPSAMHTPATEAQQQQFNEAIQKYQQRFNE